MQLLDFYIPVLVLKTLLKFRHPMSKIWQNIAKSHLEIISDIDTHCINSRLILCADNRTCKEQTEYATE